MNPTPEQVALWAREASSIGDSTELSGDALLTFATRAFTEGCAHQVEVDANAFAAEADTWKAWPQASAAKRKGVAAIRANAPKGAM